MRVRTIATLSAAIVGATLALTAAPAQAGYGLYRWSAGCAAGGMSGWLTVTYDKGANGTEIVRTIDYHIGPNGRREGNISWHDGGTAPPTDFSTGKAIQDGYDHPLPGSHSYSRGTGYTAIAFTFDKSGGDPSCGTGKNW